MSLRVPVTVWFEENITYGGSKVRLLNWEYGARLAWPALFLVEIHPIGRGTTQAWLALVVNVVI